MLVNIQIELSEHIYGDLLERAYYNNESVESYVVSLIIKDLAKGTNNVYKEEKVNVK